ncbi:MAG: helix-turn-helix domain-containing protein [Henriciella sp.]
MPHRPKWHVLKIHRNYTVEEAARVLGVCRATVRRWVKNERVPVIDDRKPLLMLGRDLIAFGKARREPKQKCGIDQAYCMSCRAPKDAAFGQMEIIQADSKTANVRMQCQTCMSLMHKRFAWRDFPRISPLARVSASQAHRHLTETYAPRLNVHFKKDE